MNQHLDDGVEELKRVDHLVMVSLKYTRTVDVIRSVIERIIASYDFFILALLTHLKDKKRIDQVPGNPVMKCELIKEKFSDNKEIMHNIGLYLNLRKTLRANFERRREYRRHVTMISNVERTTVETNIDTLTENFEKIQNFAKLIHIIINGDK